MLDTADYKDCRTIVYDEQSQSVITEATIENFEKSSYTVTLRSPAFYNRAYERVSLLIFYHGVPHEYKGTVRKSMSASGSTEISLYKGKVNEKRNAIRYPIATRGVVEHFIIIHKLVPLRVPMEIEVLNISTNGCLLQGNPNGLNISTAFQLSVDMGDTPMLINAKVVRIKMLDAQTAEYGCKLLFKI